MGDGETLRNTLCLLAVVGVMVATALHFRRITQRPQFVPVLASGQYVNLNILACLAAWLRRSDDPLRPPFVEPARIGLMHFAFMLAGMVLLPLLLVSGLIVSGLRG